MKAIRRRLSLLVFRPIKSLSFAVTIVAKSIVLPVKVCGLIIDLYLR